MNLMVIGEYELSSKCLNILIILNTLNTSRDFDACTTTPTKNGKNESKSIIFKGFDINLILSFALKKR